MKYFSNKKSRKNILAILLLVVIIISSGALAFAAEWSIGDQLVPDCKGSGAYGPSKTGGNIVECDWADLIVLANNIVRFLVFISAILATMAFCYAGFLYITAFGESGKIEQAHKIFKSALIGVFFVLCGWLIIATILKVLVDDTDPTNIKRIVPFQSVKTIQGQPR